MSRPLTSVASGSLALAMLLAGATSATASTPPVQVHYADSYDSVLPDPGDPDGSFCGGLTGVPLHTEIDGHVSVVQHGPDGATYFADRFRSTLTYTNPTTNLTFTVVRVRQTKDLRITDNGDGTLTLVGLSTGSLWSYGPDGESFGVQHGRSFDTFLVDTLGTSDPFDDVFDLLSSDQAGLYTTNGFCNDFLAATS
jgi:hypothetical protein